MTNGRFRRCLIVLALVGLSAASRGFGAAQGRSKQPPKSRIAAEDLYAQAIGQLNRRHFTRAKAVLEGIQFTPENRSAVEPLVRLAVADTLFYTGDTISLIDARSKYVEFVTLYGGHPRAAYAQFQAGVCSLKQIGSPTRDQSQTRAALTDLEEVEKTYAGSVYADAARGLITEAEAHLAEHEFQVGRFYMHRRAYFSAAERFRGILDRYPGCVEKQKVYLELGRALILAKNAVEGTIYLDKLVSDYPKDARATEARKLLASLPAAPPDAAKPEDAKPR
jgi:outer membrane protein assembly factor BamD